MTRHLRNLAPSGDADNGALMQPIAATRNLTDEVVERIAAEPFVERTRSTVVLTPLVRRPDVPRA